MTRIREVYLEVSYSQLAVFDPSMVRPFNEWNETHVAQGFSWRRGSVAFRTIQEGGPHLVIIRLKSFEDLPSQCAIRVIDVPFEVPPGGMVEIGSISDSVSIDLDPGSYQLRFEVLESTGGARPRVHLIFYKSSSPRFSLVRADSALDISRDLLLSASPA